MEDRCPLDRAWSRIEMEAEAVTLDNEETVYRVGLRDGFSEAIQLLDMLTGGDGEYRFCSIPDEGHCPTPVEMGQRIIARIEARSGETRQGLDPKDESRISPKICDHNGEL